METISNTAHASEAILRPSLTTLPLEILEEIADYTAQDTFVLPGTQMDLQYTTNNGESRQYWPWLPWTAIKKMNLRRVAVRTYNNPSADNNRSILNLALTCSRLSWACEVAIYRTAIVSGANYTRLHRFLYNITRKRGAHLQRYVNHLAVSFRVEDNFHGHALRMGQAVRESLCSGAVQLQTLRSLELTYETGFMSDLDGWYALLPTLPALEHLTLRRFRGVEVGFPALPRLREAHFYDGSPTNSALAAKSVLEKLPALRAFVNFNTFGRVSQDTFEPVRNTLETLAWVDVLHEYTADTIPNITCLRRLRHLKTGFIRNRYGNDRRGLLFWNGDCLADMASLETVEMVVSTGDQRYLRFGRGVELHLVMRKILGTFGKMKIDGQVKGLQVVDLRCFGEWTDDVDAWELLKDEFLDMAVRKYTQLGVKLLLPEMAS